MKKLLGVIVGIVVVVVAIFAFGGNDQAETESTDSGDAASGEELPKVGLLQLTSHPSLDKITEGIIDSLAENGFVDGETMTLDFQNAQGDQSNLSQMSTKFVSDGTDVMIGIATPAGQALANASSDIPIILGAVTDPENVGIVESNEEPGGNVTGVSDMTPVEDQIKLIRQILPEASTLGIMYSSSEDNSAIQAQMAEDIAKEYGFEPVVSTVTSTNDVSQIGQQLVSEVDALWVPNDNTIASAFPTLLQQADNAGIPIFPAVDIMVQQGGLATLGLNQYELGVMTGNMTAEVLRGEIDPATEPIRQGTETDLIVNFDKVEQLGIEIPEDLAAEATAAESLEESE